MLKKSLGKATYEIIEKKIINCEYAPGAILNETTLSEELQVSRTPIREAINQLENVGLVKVIPKKGILVTEVNPSDIIEIYQVRELVEPYIIEQEGPLLNYEHSRNDLIRLLQSSRESTNEAEQFLIDSELHKIIINVNRNKHIANMLKNVFALKQRARALTGSNIEDRFEETRREHIEIIEAILNENYAEAAKVMKLHLQVSKEYAVKRIMK